MASYSNINNYTLIFVMKLIDSFLLIQLSVTVLGPGLPALLYRSEIYLCHLEDFKGRFVINVPAMVVEESRRYSCDISDELRAYENLVSGIAS